VNQAPVILCSRTWSERSSELAYAIRAIAGAASRSGSIAVYVPGPPGHPEADGAFDLVPVGVDPSGGWPTQPDVARFTSLNEAVVVMDVEDSGIQPLLGLLPHSARRFALSGEDNGTHTLRTVALEADRDEHFIGLHVPINPLAAAHRHNGFGFVDYVLILSGRAGSHEVPPDEVAWVTAGFPDADVVVIENGIASVWKGRALRGSTAVDTRTDLWRLIAHARVCIDLSPGTTLAKECIEALRYGTPILVPSDATAAAVHARSGGGLTYDSMGQMVQCVTQLLNDHNRQTFSAAGRRYADSTYGDPIAFTERVRAVLHPQ
jgi:hypothetical protein